MIASPVLAATALPPYWHGPLVALLGFVVTLAATPAAMAAARRFGVMDMPDTFLKPHARPTPYLGGLAILLGWMAAAAVAVLLRGLDWGVAIPLLIGGLGHSLIGLGDDARDLRPTLRLLLTALVGIAALLLSGVGWSVLASLGGLVGQQPAWLGWLSVAVSVIVLMCGCNSMNLLDGIDGLAAGVAGVMSASFCALALALATQRHAEGAAAAAGGEPAMLLTHSLSLSIALLGACGAFLVFNFKPARVFMGDAGSLLLGYVCGLQIVLLTQVAGVRGLVASLLVVALPAFDTVLAMTRRYLLGRPIFQGDRSHFYDQLVQRGYSVPATCLVCYALTAGCGALAVATLWLSPPAAAGLLVVFACAVVVAAWVGGFVAPDAPTETPRV